MKVKDVTMTTGPKVAPGIINYPKYLDASGKAALDKLRTEIKERTQKTEIKKPEDVQFKILERNTNPFGVSEIKFSAIEENEERIATGYAYPPDQWPFDHEAVNQCLINLLTSNEPRLQRFWDQCASTEGQQAKFIYRLQGEINLWAFNKTRYEATTSDLKRKLKSAIADIQRLILKLRESHRLSGIANDEIHKALDQRYFEVFEEKEPYWNMWDEKPLQLDGLLERILQRIHKEAEEEAHFPEWYPTKMESKSANKIFLIRAIRRVMIECFSKASHVVIADMASIILGDIITEEDVRKNLVETNRKIVA